MFPKVISTEELLQNWKKQTGFYFIDKSSTPIFDKLT